MGNNLIGVDTESIRFVAGAELGLFFLFFTIGLSSNTILLFLTALLCGLVFVTFLGVVHVCRDVDADCGLDFGLLGNVGRVGLLGDIKSSLNVDM
jgi:hypothetical protein